MLTLYHTPLSINSRRVWVVLLEKGLEFETVEVDLGGDQFKPEFLAMNPFHHIPVITDGDTTVIESFAILDYLDARYPTPAMMPTSPEAIARVRMVQMVTLNELLPALTPLTRKFMGFGEPDPEAMAKAHQQADKVLSFCQQQLGDGPWFGGDQITLAEAVLGTVTPWFKGMGVDMAQTPQMQAWTERLMARPAWQQTQPTEEMLAAFRDRMAKLMAQRHG
ncbi:glutathione S-transferase family protein [filamentous cyanobacterium CCP5]|nr:glutathione S-transferase family protein [filamentous cyanobacterium CCP5]